MQETAKNIICEKIIVIFNDFIGKNKIEFSEEVFFVPVFKNWLFNNNNIQYDVEPKEEKTKKIFNFEFIQDIIQIILPLIKNNKDLLSEIPIEFSRNNDFIKKYVKLLIIHTIDKEMSNRELNPNEIFELVNDSMEGNDRITVSIYLTNIWLAKNQFEINKYLSIRRIGSEDYKYTSKNQVQSKFRNNNDPTAVLNLKINMKQYPQNAIEFYKSILKEIYFYKFLFLIFKLGSVFSPECRIPVVAMGAAICFGYNFVKQDFMKQQCIFKNTFLNIHQKVISTIDYEDIESIKAIINCFEVDNIKNLLYEEKDKRNYITIAINRFQNAFLTADKIESQITFAISCLEALFSTQSMELSRTLRQRVAITIGMFGYNNLDVYKTMGDAYNYRSAYSHGDIRKFKEITLIDRKITKIKELSSEILEYAKISILIFLQIKNKNQTGKGRFLKDR